MTGLAALTLGLLAVAGTFDCAGWLAQRLTDSGRRTSMQQVVESPGAHDISHGDDLLAAFARVRNPEQAPQALVIGNSQQYTASLPPNADASAFAPASLTSDLLAARIEADTGRKVQFYNAAAPNQNLVEALWQGIYWAKVPTTPPRAILVQASFDMFRKGGIRAGFATLLRDPQFARHVDIWAAAHSERAYAPLFASQTRSDAGEPTIRVGESIQERVELAIREAATALAVYRNRQQLRASLLGLLYTARVRLLGISPTSRRHITGAPYAQNIHALEDLLAMLTESGASVYLYNAPVNPKVAMFYAEEHRAYLDAIAAACVAPRCRFANLEHAVPADEWGYWIDGPDPIHISEAGHRTLASALYQAFGPHLLEAL